jgi:hypothetical protein
MPIQILNSEGKPIVLTEQEQRQADHNQQICNSLGFEIDITTLTTISKSIVEQKFYEVPFADYVPVRVGEGAFSSNLLTYKSFVTGGDFETGIINTGADNAKLAEVSAGVESVTVPIKNWMKGVTYSVFDLQMAARAGNWDLVTAKERSRKKNWDLGLQAVTFWGLNSDSNIKGLLTQAGVTSNTTVITKYIKDMTDTEFEALLGDLISTYRVNAAYTTFPDTFLIPEADYNGLGVSTSEDFPLKSKYQRLMDMFTMITRNPNFKILPSSYADQAVNAAVSGLDKNRYVLYKQEEDTIRMDIPVDYTNTLANTINNVQFQSAAYGQFTGVVAYRPLEILYFDWND